MFVVDPPPHPHPHSEERSRKRNLRWLPVSVNSLSSALHIDEGKALSGVKTTKPYQHTKTWFIMFPHPLAVSIQIPFGPTLVNWFYACLQGLIQDFGQGGPEPKMCSTIRTFICSANVTRNVKLYICVCLDAQSQCVLCEIPMQMLFTSVVSKETMSCVLRFASKSAKGVYCQKLHDFKKILGAVG